MQLKVPSESAVAVQMLTDEWAGESGLVGYVHLFARLIALSAHGY